MKLNIFVCILLLLTGCAIIPDDSAKTTLRDAAAIQLSSKIKLAKEGWPSARWWTQYQDEQLNSLMNAALKTSPSLSIAQARVELAQSEISRAKASGGIDVASDLTTTREMTSKYGMYPPPLAGTWITDSEPMLQAIYHFDWWGKNKAAIAAELGETAARKADEAEAEQTLTASIAQTYFNWQTDQARINLLKQELELRNKLHKITRLRAKHGIDDNSAPRSAFVDVASQDNAIVQLQVSAAQELEALRALVGANGDSQVIDNLVVRTLPKSAGKIPDNLALNLVARRPDLQAARWRVEASYQQIKKSKAEFYPDINIRAFFGFSSLSLDDLLKIGTRTYGLSPSINLPIFDSGRLKADLQKNWAKRDVAIAQYNQALVNAVRDVANNGVALQGMQAQEKIINGWLNSLQKVQENQQKRLAHGILDQSSALRADFPVLSIKEQLLILKNRQLNTEIALINALGGGYAAQSNAAVSSDKK